MRKTLLLIFFTILFQSNCFAAQAAGVGGLILFAAFIIFIVGASIFAYIGSKIAANSAEGGWLGVTLFMVLSVIFFGYSVIDSRIREEFRKEMSAQRIAAEKQAESKLMERCKDEERFLVYEKIEPGTSISIDIFPDSKAPTATTAPPVVTASDIEKKAKKYGYEYAFPPLDNSRQYEKLISWIQSPYKTLKLYDSTVAGWMQTDLIDIWDPEKNEYQRLATKERWEKDGLSSIPTSYLAANNKRPFDSLPDKEFVSRIPIDRNELSVRYVFTIEDISTLDDRKNWIARGRMRLTNTATGNVAAEYIGFQSLLDGARACPDARKIASDSHGALEPIRFFFKKIFTPEQ